MRGPPRLPERLSIVVAEALIHYAQNCGGAPSPAALRASDLSPHAGRGEGKAFPFSRGTFLFAPPSYEQRKPRTTPYPDLRQINPAVDGRVHHDQARLTNERKRKGSRTPTDAGLRPHLSAKREPWPRRARLSAFHCGSCQRDSRSPRLCVREAIAERASKPGRASPLMPCYTGAELEPPMIAEIARHRAEFAALCRRFGVRRLDVFGSGARETDFAPDVATLIFWSSSECRMTISRALPTSKRRWKPCWRVASIWSTARRSGEPQLYP